MATTMAQSVAAGFTQYAYAFVAFEAEKTESVNAKAAFVLRERAARLYGRAHRHAMRALELSAPGFSAALRQPDPKQHPRLTQSQVPLAYWAAASLGGWISMSKDDPDLVADLPLSMRLATLAWQTQPEFGQGALASLMGTLELARPGGVRERALQYFDQAIEVSQGQAAGPWVAKAEGWAVDQQDRQAFVRWLDKALQVSAGKRDLSSQIMRERAQWLLSQVDSIF